MQMLQAMRTKLDACLESNSKLEARLAAVESRPAAPLRTWVKFGCEFELTILARLRGAWRGGMVY